jgi:hypothetical protein
LAHKVFICHSSKDKPLADAACAALEAQRISCWIAPRDILAGVEYGEAIIDALSRTQIVLLIFSKNSNESPQVRREIERAVNYEKIIVPYRIEDVLPTRAMEFALSNTHWLDALTPPMERRLSELTDTVARLLRRHVTPGDELWKQRNKVTGGAAGGPASEAAVPMVTVDSSHPVEAAEQILGPAPTTVSEMEPEPTPMPVEPEAVATPAAPEQIRICPRCGREFPPRNLHCPVDGAALGPAHERYVRTVRPATGPSMKECPACGTRMVAAANFCPKCGRRQS